MIIFLTSMSYGRTAEDLDTARLHAAQNQGSALFDMLTGIKDPGNLKHHPVLSMWRGYEFALGIYVMSCGLEWCFQRGFAENKSFWNVARGIKEIKNDDPNFVYEVPPWFRDRDVILSHRSNLLRRSPEHYEDKWELCPEDWPYFWPVIDADQEDGYKLLLSKADKARVKNGERKLPAAQKKRVANWP